MKSKGRTAGTTASCTVLMNTGRVVGASPWPAAVGWQLVQGQKSNQLLHGRDFLF